MYGDEIRESHIYPPEKEKSGYVSLGYLMI